MSNTFKTLADGDIVRIMLDSFHNKSVFLNTINKDHEKDFAKDRHKNGGTILIKNPNEYIVGTGAVISTQAITETTQPMTVATQKNIPVTITSYERSMSLDDFQEEVADPAMARLTAEIEYYTLSQVYKKIFNLTGTPATTPASLTAITNAGVKLTQGLAPEDNRHLLLDPVAMGAVQGSVAAYFHKQSEIEKAFQKGYLGEAQGFAWHQSAMVPTHTNGTRTDATPVVNTSTGITSGSSTITTTGQTNAQTLCAGDVFTIQDVYAINRETKQRYSHLQQFVVLTAMTCDATDDIVVSPTPYTSGAQQNVEIVSAGSGKAIVHVASGGSGAASAVYTQNLAYHKDFCTFATAPLPLPYGDKGAMATYDNITMRMWQFSDGINDSHTTRFDVLFGFLVQRPEFAVRVRG